MVNVYVVTVEVRHQEGQVRINTSTAKPIKVGEGGSGGFDASLTRFGLRKVGFYPHVVPLPGMRRMATATKTAT